MDLLIESSGTVRCVFGEQIDLGQLGRLSIRRGSHVEPTPDGQWTADLSLVQGPLLGPFPTRTAALNAEVTWLQEHWLLPSR
jgi:hypothetical protein